MSALAATFQRAAAITRVAPAHDARAAGISKIIAGMDLRELGEEAELLEFGGGHEPRLID